jgi:hypothetical protein
MCRSIKTLANFEPSATDDEIRAAAIQFVRKLSGASRPSRANELVFDRAVDEVTAAASRLIRDMTTTAPPRDRAVEVQKARERTRERYGQASLAAASPANRGAASQKPGLEAGC